MNQRSLFSAALEWLLLSYYIDSSSPNIVFDGVHRSSSSSKKKSSMRDDESENVASSFLAHVHEKYLLWRYK